EAKKQSTFDLDAYFFGTSEPTQFSFVDPFKAPPKLFEAPKTESVFKETAADEFRHLFSEKWSEIAPEISFIPTEPPKKEMLLVEEKPSDEVDLIIELPNKDIILKHLQGELTPQDIQAFESKEFYFGQIPEIPPPLEYCV